VLAYTSTSSTYVAATWHQPIITNPNQCTTASIRGATHYSGDLAPTTPSPAGTAAASCAEAAGAGRGTPPAKGLLPLVGTGSLARGGSRRPPARGPGSRGGAAAAALALR
jgi:hypothetical protein